VKEVGDEIANMHEALQQTVQDAQKKGNALPDPDSFEEDEDNYAQFEQEQQMQIMHDQDEALDGVFRTVGNLRMQADDMGRELEEQGEMLKDVDTVADRVGGKLQTGMKKVNTIIRKNEGNYPDSHVSSSADRLLKTNGRAAALRFSFSSLYCFWCCCLFCKPRRLSPTTTRTKALPVDAWRTACKSTSNKYSMQHSSRAMYVIRVDEVLPATFRIFCRQHMSQTLAATSVCLCGIGAFVGCSVKASQVRCQCALCSCRFEHGTLSDAYHEIKRDLRELAYGTIKDPVRSLKK